MNRLWDAWKTQYSNLVEAFASNVEEARRRGIFKENIEWFQARGGSYLLDETTILTADEFRRRGKASCASSSIENDEKLAEQQLAKPTFSCPVLVSLLDITYAAGKDQMKDFIIDYRGTQVTPVKNQGAFGTCWSFGFAETIEGLGVRQGHALTNVSNQEVIDCCPNCRGSSQDASFGFVIGNPTIHGRLATDEAYPYHGSPETCFSAKMSQSQLAPAHVGGCLRVMDDADRTGEPVLIGLAILGPAAFGIDAACLRGYKGGIITNCTDAHVNHEVLLVGTGLDEDSGVAFFRAKNSWGAEWGEKGYFRFAQEGGQLGMASVVFATDHAMNGPALDATL
jgi:C1A family cysteine protease